ncbi:importin subunit beta-1-like isoform X2 [Lineus longissimus]
MAFQPDLLTILSKTVSPDQAELQAAQNFLEQAALLDLPGLLKELSDILRNESNPAVARVQAGLQLKNAFYSKDEETRQKYVGRWLTFPEQIRLEIKENVLNSLGTESESIRPSQAAQCIASIACAELPNHLWPGMVAKLTTNVTTQGSTEMLKESTLEAIGYICQDIDPDILACEANAILTAIVNGMKKEESNRVRLAATNALLNSLEFTKANFAEAAERHYIMQIVCEATQSDCVQVRVAALQCLVKILTLYYKYMEDYMGPALFAITLEAMRSNEDEVALQGIEFWSNVCDEEVDLAIELSEAHEQGRPPERSSQLYAKGALPYLIPILQETLTKQEECDDDDEWNPCKAAGVCMMLLASCCEDPIVDLVMPWMIEKIANTDWRYRDAAIMSFGCILEGPDPTKFNGYLPTVMPLLVKTLSNEQEHVVVKDTAAWTVGRICEIIPEAVINEKHLMPLLGGLVKELDSDPRVASNVCWAFSSLAEAAYEAADTPDDTSEPPTYCLSSVFQVIVNKLLMTTDRPDGGQHNLRSAAYEALMELVKNSPKDCYPIVQEVTVIILDRLEKVLQLEDHIQSTSDRAVYNDLQSLLCATLQSVLRKVSTEHAIAISDPIMKALLVMFSRSSGKCGGVQEDALLAVSTLVEVLSDKFSVYLEAFKPYLLIGLNNYAEYQVCLAAIGLVGDICRAMNGKVLDLAKEIMPLLLVILKNEAVHRSVKPQILSVFGDIALAIGADFRVYMDVVLQTLFQASQAQVQKTDLDMIDYLNDLREGVLEAYTGIVQGLKGDGQPITNDIGVLMNHVAHMTMFIEMIALDEDKSDSNIACCCGLIGDLCTIFGTHVVPLLDKESINNLLLLGRKSKTNKTKTLGMWASRELRKLKNPQS